MCEFQYNWSHSLLLPWFSYICSPYLCLYCCSSNKIINTIFSRLHIYALIYNICFSLSNLVHSVWQFLSPSMSTQMTQFCCFLMAALGFPCGSAGKECTCNAGDLCSIPGLGRSPGEGKGYPLQYSGLENSMDYIVCGVTKSQTQLSNSHFNGCIIFHCVYICAPSSLSIPLLMDALVASIVLAIVNSAAMNTGMHVSFWIMVFSGYQ